MLHNRSWDFVLKLVIHHSSIPIHFRDRDLSLRKKTQGPAIVSLNYRCTCRCILVSWRRCIDSHEKSSVRSNWYLAADRNSELASKKSIHQRSIKRLLSAFPDQLVLYLFDLNGKRRLLYNIKNKVIYLLTGHSNRTNKVRR